MAGFEEVCVLEGMGTPLQVRLELRQMFERWLPRSCYPRPFFEQDGMPDELGFLELCQHYRLEYPGAAKDVAKVWDKSEERIADGGPTFDELVRQGWVLFDGGRWTVQSAPLGTLSCIAYPSSSAETFLTGLNKLRLIAKTDTQPQHVRALADRILNDGCLDRSIPTRNPDWLAGRLWEYLCPIPQPRTVNNSSGEPQQPTRSLNEASGTQVQLASETEAVDQAFLEWSAWCDLLHGAGKWDTSWGSTEMHYCREAAHRALGRQALWGVWSNDAARYAEVLLQTFGIPHARVPYVRAPKNAAPSTLVFKCDWLKRREVEHLIMERLGSSTVSFAFRLLCSELESTDIGRNVMARVDDVISFATDHPMALQQFLSRVDAVPALLVDMLMHQSSVCLAVKMAIEWRARSGQTSDRAVSREAQTKEFVIQDALSLLAHHLNEGMVDPEECAALVTWCYTADTGNRRTGADSRKLVGHRLLRMLAKGKPELQREVLRYLVDQADYEDNVPRARFLGVLNGLAYLSGAAPTDTSPIVALYTKFARALHLSRTDASNLPAELAAQLVATAFTLTEAERDQLLVPFESAKLLREAPGDERPSLSSSIAQTLRGHVRLLARAVAGWPGTELPTELCDTLQELISRNVIEHAEKGRLGALTDRYSPSRFLAMEIGSPAQDLTDAWRRLDSERQEVMLQVLARSDDPVLLAQLCQHLPANAKHGIQARLRQLKPGEASELWTWPELQHRVESLLAAEEVRLAREHLDEAQQSLHLAPPNFRLGLFGLELQLLLKEKNWAALDRAAVPSELDLASTQQARDQLDFYKATSELLRHNGNLEGALVVLQRLSARPGAASAYKENAFAVAMHQLMGPNLHPLSGPEKMAGERLLAEINVVVGVNEQLAGNNLLANRAMLLLALQRPEDAIESVAKRRREIRNPELELAVVLAKFEIGHREDAMAILDAAITEFDANERLIFVKNDLQAGIAATNVALPTIAVDPTSAIRISLQQLAELPPSQVGEILGPTGRGLRGYLVRQVSNAVAALQHMAAMLRQRKNPDDDAKFENDLNTAVRQILGASLAIPKWNVSDQSLGGSTVSGNPGERDAVIRASNQEISIYEALVCSGLDRAYTKKHFDKLLSYGICDIYFHVTYSYAKKLKPLFDYIRYMLEHEVPTGLSFIGCEIIEPPDHETSGYIATYRADHREVAVVFLIADLRT